MTNIRLLKGDAYASHVYPLSIGEMTVPKGVVSVVKGIMRPFAKWNWRPQIVGPLP